MDRESFRTLRLLEALSAGDQVTQRELAGRLGVSVGLVNAFLKRLAKKGYMKVTTIPANRVRYLLTKEGFKEKTRLTYEYLQYSLGFYQSLKGVLGGVYRDLRAQGVEKVAFYLAGEVAELAYLHLTGTGLEFYGIFDPEPRGRRLLGHNVLPLDMAQEVHFDRIVIASLNETGERKRELLDAGIEEERIVTLEP